MYKIELRIKNYASICIYTDLENIVSIFKNKKNNITKTVPISDIIITEAKNENITQCDVIHLLKTNNIKSMSFDNEKNAAYMFSSEKEMSFVDLVYVILCMFSNILQKDDKYLIHSSAVKYDEESSLIFLGEANAGKTSMAYKFIKDYGCKLISNDHALIGFKNGRLATFTGTKNIQMRLGAIKLYFPELLKYISINDEDEWERKILLDSIVGNEIEYADDSYVTNIFNISTYKQGDTFLRKKEITDQILLLYEHLSRQLKKTHGLIIGFNYPMPSFENDNIMLRLANNCRTMLNSCEIYESKGTIDELSERIVKTYAKK